MLRVTTRTRPCDGETVNGDRAVFRVDGNRSLVAVIDALGHGPRAAEVSDLAERVLGELALDAGAERGIATLHDALRGGRGAAVTLAIEHAGMLEVAGVGNVALRVAGQTFGWSPGPGVVGGRMRSARAHRLALREGTRLVLHSDGVSGRFDPEAWASLPLDAVADEIFAAHGKTHDDATLLIADYRSEA